MTNVQLIVSHYEKNLDWVKNINNDIDVVIYSKNDKEDGFIKLKNIGREPHTYFHHIVENYDNLPEWLILSQDAPQEHVHNWVGIINGGVDLWESTCVSTNNKMSYFFTIYNRMVCSDRNGNPDHGGLPMVEVWNKIFNTEPPEVFHFTPSCHLIVNKKLILSKPKDFYVNIIEVLENNQLSPWVVERFMNVIF